MYAHSLLIIFTLLLQPYEKGNGTQCTEHELLPSTGTRPFSPRQQNKHRIHSWGVWPQIRTRTIMFQFRLQPGLNLLNFKCFIYFKRLCWAVSVHFSLTSGLKIDTIHSAGQENLDRPAGLCSLKFAAFIVVMVHFRRLKSSGCRSAVVVSTNLLCSHVGWISKKRVCVFVALSTDVRSIIHRQGSRLRPEGSRLQRIQQRHQLHTAGRGTWVHLISYLGPALCSFKGHKGTLQGLLSWWLNAVKKRQLPFCFVSPQLRKARVLLWSESLNKCKRQGHFCRESTWMFEIFVWPLVEDGADVLSLYICTPLRDFALRPELALHFNSRSDITKRILWCNQCRWTLCIWHSLDKFKFTSWRRCVPSVQMKNLFCWVMCWDYGLMLSVDVG